MTSRIRYYLSSIPTIFGQIENWPLILMLLWGKRPVIRLRNGCRFRVRSLMDVWIVKETCLDRQYELYGTPIEDGWTVVDIGAGLGDFAILIARENPHSHIYAYEPFPDSYQLLEENIALNNVYNISSFQVAVGARNEKVRLFAKGEAVQHTILLEGHSDDSIPYTEVQGVTLNDAFAINGIERCDFLKMDCEGCEFDVLFGTSPTTLERISRICLEYHDGFTRFTHTDLIGYLHQYGFQTRITPNPVHPYLGFLYAYRP
ncbi:MAG: FkbM family methyltransferase [Thermoflexales bacterium]|nr:FkbM family methyltransferase [Thermoflexales bacterium]